MIFCFWACWDENGGQFETRSYVRASREQNIIVSEWALWVRWKIGLTHGTKKDRTDRRNSEQSDECDTSVRTFDHHVNVNHTEPLL